MTLGYPYAGNPDAWLDMFGESGGTMFLTDQGSSGRAVYHSPGTYRTICSAVIFGALTPSADRARLMSAYMDYLLYGLGVAEQVPARLERLSVGPNPAVSGRAVRFQAPPGARRLTVLDVSGRTVADLSLGAGERTANWTPQVAPGTYLVRATGPALDRSRPFVVVR